MSEYPCCEVSVLCVMSFFNLCCNDKVYEDFQVNFDKLEKYDILIYIIFIFGINKKCSMQNLLTNFNEIFRLSTT